MREMLSTIRDSTHTHTHDTHRLPRLIGDAPLHLHRPFVKGTPAGQLTRSCSALLAGKRGRDRVREERGVFFSLSSSLVCELRQASNHRIEPADDGVLIWSLNRERRPAWMWLEALKATSPFA